MARGRAPSQHAYRGSVGQTRHRTVHVTTPRGELAVAQVLESVDAVADPELARRLLDDATWNQVTMPDGAIATLAVTVVYHDPAAEVLAVVIPEDQRHRELDERIALLERMRGDAEPVPPYAREYAVVFGAGGLRAYLEKQAEEALIQGRIADQLKDLERRRAEIERKEADVARKDADGERARAELDRVRADIERRWSEVDARGAALTAREREMSEAAAAAPPLPSPPVVVHAPVPVEPARRNGNGNGNGNGHAHAAPAAPAPVAAAAGKARHLDEDTPDILTSPFELQAQIDLAVDAPRAPGPSAPRHVDAATIVTAPPQTWDVGGAVPASRPMTPAPARAPVAPIHDDPEGESTGKTDPPEGATAAPAPAPAPTPAAVVHGDGSDPLTTTTTEVAAEARGADDAWLASFAEAGTPWAIAAADGHPVRLGFALGDGPARAMARGALDVRLMLHRTEHYPVVTLVVGPPGAIRAGVAGACAFALLDITDDADRAALAQLGKTFALHVDLLAGAGAAGGVRRLRQVVLTAPLTENVGFVMRAAEDHLRTLMAEGGVEPAIGRGRAVVGDPGFDVFGEQHPESGEFRDDKLAGLETANQVRRALAIAKRFTKPAREDYLVCVRGFPLPRWREVRRRVLERAVEWGLWMGPELAQVAVSEGFARSRRDLVVKLMPAFEALRGSPAFDLDGDAAEDNHKVLVDEARGLGVALGDRSRTVDSEAAVAASGTIDPPRAGAAAIDEPWRIGGGGGPTGSDGGAGDDPRGIEPPRTQRTVAELVAALDTRGERLAAAIELCERADPRTLPQVFAAVKKMSRAEAVRVLGMAVRFGPAAAPHLLEGLASEKAYLRHGCALGLAMLRTDGGTDAVIELLLSEPTEVWREIARAVGQVGPPALMPLASQLGRLGERATASAKERVAWAMAHVAVRGGKAAVEALAGGASVVAPVAGTALELLASAANDEVRVRSPAGGTSPGREVTVNRAFSRRFFEALEKGLPEVGGAELSAMEAAEPMELLDDDLLEEDLDEEVAVDLDESDIDESDIIAS
jgi:hypothetical protein